MSRCLLYAILVRAGVLFLGLNLAQPLEILPQYIGDWKFLPLFNILSVTLSLTYIALWWNGRGLYWQLWVQIGMDLALASVVVASTGGLSSPFVSFYLLIIIYCSLTLGRTGAAVCAALSTTLYAAIVGMEHLGLLGQSGAPMEMEQLTFRISLNALGFIAVAFLGTYLCQRLEHVQEELERKVDSLRDLQRLNEHIVSSIRSGLVTTDLHGSITLFNRAAQELTGKSESEARRASFSDMFGREFWARITDGGLLRSPRPMRHEIWTDSPGEQRRFLGFSVSPLLDHGRRLIGYIVSFQDLTEIRQLEEEVRIKDRLATIGRMAAGIAHEIRNPLTSVQGSVEILRSRANLPRADERLLEILVHESDRLNEFVEDLLYFARPGKYTRRPADLAPLLRDAVILLRNNPEVAGRHEIDLQLESDSIVVLGSPDKLKQVFWNLAQNGLRAMPDGGRLTVRAGRTDDGGAHISFEDAGVGLSPEEENDLFQPFHSGFSGGTGLGLSIVFQILEDHGGKIHFDSEKGRGTRVTLLFPPAPVQKLPVRGKAHAVGAIG
ncbi:MAG: PAS domain S-box protein [Acidobacteria bacterium]|nr:PAS domain S-box protein [Acidobacteriota bacterium]